MALVDPKLLESLSTPKRPPSLPIRAMSGLDDDMRGVLDRQDIGEEEKVKFYNQILRRYVTYEDKLNQPMKVQITHSPAPPPIPSSGESAESETNADQHILETVPTTMRRKARLLLDKVRQNSNVTWDSSGRVSINGEPMQDANIVDLLNDVLRKRKRPNPVGWEKFAKGLKEANVPRELVGNKERWAFMRGERVTATPIQKRRKKVVSKSRWTTY